MVTFTAKFSIMLNRCVEIQYVDVGFITGDRIFENAFEMHYVYVKSPFNFIFNN